jgi:hypothetical protein
MAGYAIQRLKPQSYKMKGTKETFFCLWSGDKMNTCFLGSWAPARSFRSGIWANNSGGAASGKLGYSEVLPGNKHCPGSQVNWDKAQFMQEPNHRVGREWGMALSLRLRDTHSSAIRPSPKKGKNP